MATGIQLGRPRKRRLRLVIQTGLGLAFALLAGCGAGSTCDTPNISLLIPYVGQGHGIALVTDRKAIVFDAGPPDQGGLAQALRNANVESIDAILLTHPDLDHWGGLDSLVGNFPVAKLIHGPVDSARRAQTFAWACRQTLSGCDTIWNGASRNFRNGLHVETLWPDSGGIFPEPNDGSLVLRVSRGDHGLLLVSGDLDTLGEQTMAPYVRHADVVQLGHHGSRSSGSLQFLGTATPRWVVVQYGRDNDYGHPTAQALSRARAVGATILDPATTENVKIDFVADDCGM